MLEIQDNNLELSLFFQALADETCFKMAELLPKRPRSGEELAELLKLADAALVTSRTEGHSKLHSLRVDAVRARAGQLLARDSCLGVDPGAPIPTNGKYSRISATAIGR
jgi:hypothetical protein